MMALLALVLCAAFVLTAAAPDLDWLLAAHSPADSSYVAALSQTSESRSGGRQDALALVRRFCLEAAGKGCICGGWLPLALAGISPTHAHRLPPPLVCPGRPFSARRASATASNVPRWLSALLLPLTGWFGQVVTAKYHIAQNLLYHRGAGGHTGATCRQAPAHAPSRR